MGLFDGETTEASKSDGETSVDADAKVDGEAYAKLRHTAALSMIRKAAEYIEANRTRFSNEVVEKARMQLRLAKNTVEEGNALLVAGSVRDATRHFEVGFQTAHEVFAFLRTQLAIDAKPNIKIEFRPVTPTILPAEKLMMEDRDDAMEEKSEAEMKENSGSGSMEMEGKMETKVEVNL